MGDLKTHWTNPPAPDPGLDGAGVTQRGGETMTMDGAAGLQTAYDNPVVPTPSGSETANASGLPLQPTRWEPSEKPDGPPDLTDRRPGNVDKP